MAIWPQQKAKNFKSPAKSRDDKSQLEAQPAADGSSNAAVMGVFARVAGNDSAGMVDMMDAYTKHRVAQVDAESRAFADKVRAVGGPPVIVLIAMIAAVVIVGVAFAVSDRSALHTYLKFVIFALGGTGLSASTYGMVSWRAAKRTAADTALNPPEPTNMDG